MNQPTTVDDIDQSLIDAHVMDRDGYPYLIHPLTDGVPRVHPGLLIDFAEWAAALPETKRATVLVAPEAMGIPLAAALSMKTGIPYVVVRKRDYELAGETMAYCETGYGQTCLYINDLHPGDRVLIVDDVISTGGTLDSLLDTLDAMDVEVLGAAIFLDKGEAAPRVAERHDAPVHVMRRIRIQAGRVQVVT